MTDRGYGRISLDTLVSGSISKQRQRIGDFGAADLEWYADESVSGAKVPLWERPAGSRLMADLCAGDRVLVTKIDRAARSVKDLLTLIEKIEASGASIVFVDQNIDTRGPMGKFMLVLLGAVAELEAAIVGERRIESLEEFAKQGRHVIGSAPVGFRSVENPNGRGLVIRPDPATASAAREAVRRILAGESQNRVRESLGLSKTGMHAWLHNPRLAGMTPSGEGVVVVDGNPRVDPDAALLTMAEWRELEEYLLKPEPKKWSKREGYGEVLLCGVCRERMYLNVSKRANQSTGATHDTYTCLKAKHARGEGAPSIMAHAADAYIENSFLDRFGGREVVVESIIDSGATRMEAVSVAQVRLAEAQRRFNAASTEDEDRATNDAVLAAKRALREAEILPSERKVELVGTGRTVGQTWVDADNAERCRLLARYGRWVLRPGRGRVEDRLTVESDELLHSLLARPVGPDNVLGDLALGFMV